MNMKNKLLSKNEKLAVIGLGYVGMPIAIEFAKKLDVIGFDVNKNKIKTYLNGIDPTNEVGNESIKNTTMKFTYEEKDLKNAQFFVVAVPTPINQDKTPDLTPVIEASKLLGRNISSGSYVVFESTVYPGVTEEVCIPILEEVSGLKCGVDFKVGYSPERINPGDKINTLTNIVKIVSGVDDESIQVISDVYEIIIKAGTYKASTIKVAEAAKVAENSQRDINIAFMNELAKVFNIMEIDTNDVVEAMKTKWNSLPFTPGLVGGHCIGVDPYYFLYQAEKIGYHSQIIQSGRKINDSMGHFIAHETIKKMINADIKINNSEVVIFGVTFKENTPDIRNSKVFDIAEKLEEFGIKLRFVDSYADRNELHRDYKITLTDINEIHDADCIIFTVPHDDFKVMNIETLNKFFKIDTPDENKVIIDVKSIFNLEKLKQSGSSYWRL